MPGTNTRAVAEMTLALMLSAKRRLAAFDGALRARAAWRWPPERQVALSEVAGSRVGLVGFGAVPRMLAPVLTAMGADVAYTGRRRVQDAPCPFLDKAELLATCDVVSLHIPETPETRGWLGRADIATMKAGAVLVNTARGGLVDEAALVEALATGQLGAAGLDVFALEPVAADNPLLALENVVVTPHVAWFTRETLERSLAVAVENCERLAAGRDLVNRVA
jgi:phosphoglycerate dehydrogenase-like enzyme